MTREDLADLIAACRAEKARKLFEVAARYDMKTADFDLMDEWHWRMLAEAARVRPPSDKTKVMVVDLMRQRNVRVIR